MKKSDNHAFLSKDEALIAFASGDNARIIDALLSITFSTEDWKWCQDQCLMFLRDDTVDISVQKTAVICLGHIARMHRCIDVAVVTAQLKTALTNPLLAAYAAVALDDISLLSEQAAI